MSGEGWISTADLLVVLELIHAGTFPVDCSEFFEGKPGMDKPIKPTQMSVLGSSAAKKLNKKEKNETNGRNETNGGNYAI